MSMWSTFEKIAIWILRSIQMLLCGAIIGPLTWFLKSDYNPAGVKPPLELILPLGVAWVALALCAVSYLLICCFRAGLMKFYALWDLLMCILFVVSAVVYKNNFSFKPGHNHLSNEVEAIRVNKLHEETARFRVGSCVRLVAAAICIQILLFFITAILSWRASTHYKKKSNKHHA